jgi:DNA-binding GntR family transcriptional regulator
MTVRISGPTESGQRLARPRSQVTRRLNLGSHIPLYIQLTEILKERIESGHWEPGSRFASEGEIGAEFKVSRAVVRPAIAILVTDGQLVKLKGRGVFVAPKKVGHRVDGLIRSLLTADAGQVSNHIIDLSEEMADESLAGALDVAASKVTVTHVMSLVEVQGRPIGLRDSYISPLLPAAVLQAIISGFAQEPPQLPDGMRLHRSETEIEVSSATPYEAETLSVKAGSPTILATYRDHVRLASGDIASVEFARMAYRADITSFEFTSS